MEWKAARIDLDAVDLDAGQYVCTVYAPRTPVSRAVVHMDMRRGAQGRLWLAYTGTLEDLPADIKGAYRRSMHRPALEALQAQWTVQGLRALAHTAYPVCGPWCGGGRCPLPQPSTAQAGTAHT